jgi:microcystin-dependent protein
MAEPFLAEVRIVGFNFAPRGYAQCDGQILPINQNQSLFALLGTTYGGDGRTTFALPEMRGRAPMHRGSINGIGNRSGQENVSLAEAEIPSHDHVVRGTTNTAVATSPAGGLQATTGGGRRPITPYTAVAAGNLVSMRASGTAGTGQGHNNMQPYQALNFVIAIQGTFPSRN